jgi:hypothetical protein
MKNIFKKLSGKDVSFVDMTAGEIVTSLEV